MVISKELILRLSHIDSKKNGNLIPMDASFSVLMGKLETIALDSLPPVCAGSGK